MLTHQRCIASLDAFNLDYKKIMFPIGYHNHFVMERLHGVDPFLLNMLAYEANRDDHIRIHAYCCCAMAQILSQKKHLIPVIMNSTSTLKYIVEEVALFDVDDYINRMKAIIVK